jgi:hypothetical protein
MSVSGQSARPAYRPRHGRGDRFPWVSGSGPVHYLLLDSTTTGRLAASVRLLLAPRGPRRARRRPRPRRRWLVFKTVRIRLDSAPSPFWSKMRHIGLRLHRRRSGRTRLSGAHASTRRPRPTMGLRRTAPSVTVCAPTLFGIDQASAPTGWGSMPAGSPATSTSTSNCERWSSCSERPYSSGRSEELTRVGHVGRQVEATGMPRRVVLEDLIDAHDVARISASASATP